MSSSSTNKGYILQVTGENPNSWGTQLNNNMISVVDLNVGGNLSISVAGNTDVTPTTSQAQNLFHKLTGALTGNINYILPTAGGFYTIDNQTTGAFTVTVKTSAGTGVVAPQGYASEVRCDAANFLYADTSGQHGRFTFVAAGGGADAITATYAPVITVLQDGMELRFRATAANATTTPTFAPNGLTARTITKNGGSALVAGDIPGNLAEVTVRYNLANTRWELLTAKSFTGGTLTSTTSMSGAAFNDTFTTIASAATTNIGAAAANYLQVTGVTTITAFDTVQSGTERTLEFAGALTLTNNANIILAGGVNLTTYAGLVVLVRSEGAGVWRQMTGNRPFGSTAQVVSNETGAVATGTTVMAFNDTIPTNTGGDQYMSQAITPTNTNSTLIIDVIWNGASSVAGNLSFALFQDATVNALAAVSVAYPTGGNQEQIVLRHKMTAGTVSSTTFKVRAGNSVAGTTTFNGAGGARFFGGVYASSITVTEVLP